MLLSPLNLNDKAHYLCFRDGFRSMKDERFESYIYGPWLFELKNSHLLLPLPSLSLLSNNKNIYDLPNFITGITTILMRFLINHGETL